MKEINKPIVLLDMDGVICNFIQGVIDSLKLTVDYKSWATWDYHHKLDITDHVFWQATQSNQWWSALDPYPWTAYLLHRLAKANTHVLFTSSPSLASDCTSQKVDWLRNHGFMGLHVNDYVLGPHKYLMARHPNTVLVDDSEANITTFERNDGKAVLFPAPWNSKAAHDPFVPPETFLQGKIDDVVEEILSKLRLP